ncbi:hypothetical protein KJ951_03035 [Patescibacteria group bacterium]|nr:hypothetical protein [Patescibacteria group bacterium]MBU1954199.1 hypothetical protein [Patescibacteria group bacterium]
MNKACKQCGSGFEVTDEDLEFYKKVSPVINGKRFDIPAPTLCADCRQQRRLTYRNERNLYKRKSDFSGKSLISNYSQDKQYKVYGYDEWWGDGFNPLDYGRDFDFSRPFFEQFAELLKEVPRLYLYNPHSENSEYTNHCYHNKNCYLIFNAAYNEDVYYSSNLIVSCKDCSDCMTAERGERLYECMYIKNCFNSSYLIHCSGCMDSMFLYDCKGCINCFQCWNSRNKKFCIKNKQYSKDEYFELMKLFNSGDHNQLNKAHDDFNKLLQTQAIHKALHVENSENCFGDYIFNSRNVRNTFYADKCEDITYCFDALGNKDCMDTYESSINCELQYECYACNESSNMKFCVLSQFSHGLTYCDYCFHSKYCFGCTGLKKQEYCILNKRYSKEQYEELTCRIIEHMKGTGEWGEFFPILLSPFAYNETVAQDFHPMNEYEISDKGWSWKEKGNELKYVENKMQPEAIPSDIKDVDDGILKSAIICESTDRLFKIIPKELEFYKKQNLPIPRFHPDERFRRRLIFKNPRKIWKRGCSKCTNDIYSSYSPDRPEKVYCEKCYLGEVY